MGQDSPGTIAHVIATARRERGLSQREFAAQVGLANHGDISQWETGRRNVPKSRLEQIASALGLELEELDRLHAQAAKGAQRQRAAAAIGWATEGRHAVGNMDARSRCRVFCGRDRELSDIARHLQSDGAVALIGMPGVGKTQLARAYAHRYADEYDLLWLVNAAAPSAVPLQIAELLPIIGGQSSRDVDHDVEAVLRALRARGRWLLVFDDAESPDVVRPFAPTDAGGHVLVSSRNRAWRSFATPLLVEPLALEASEEFLRRRSGRAQDNPASLAKTLGGLPLALEQAAGVIESVGVSFALYETRLRDAPTAVLSRGEPSLYDRSVAKTLHLAMRELVEHDSDAKSALVRAALCGAAPIPLPLVASARTDAVVRALENLSLGRRSEDAIHVHPLVQLLVRDGVSREDAAASAAAVAVSLRELLPDDGYDPAGWPKFDALVPHALALSERFEDPSLVVALGNLAGYLGVRGQVERGAEVARVGVAMARKLQLGAELADALHNLGGLLREQLHTAAGARQCFEESLAIRRQLPGDQNLRIAGTSAALAALLLHTDPAAARTLFEQALATIEAAEGPEHPFAIIVLGETSRALELLGDVEQSAAMRRRAVELSVLHLGEGHPITADAWANLALLSEGAIDQDERSAAAARAVELYESLGVEDEGVEELRTIATVGQR